MKISLLNEKIKIEKLEIIKDEMGNQSKKWVDFLILYTTISGQSPNEALTNGAVWDVNNIDFTIRYSKEASLLDSRSYRVVFKGDYYDILGIDYMNFKKKALKLKCKKIERNKDEGINN
ncbi:phage head closure protein [Helcococcus bovis]|uniref:phage head closure protein n=1 Tax=Helcococcus bovis TaxID=3153252 RepID=UPI0038B835C1